MVKKVFIVDSSPVFRQGLKTIIENEEGDLITCGDTAHAEDALLMLKNYQPDLIVMDLCLTNANGLRLIHRIRCQNKQIKILVSSSHNEILFAERSIRLGANGYINKNESSTTMIQAMHRVLDSKIYLSQAVKEYLVNRQLKYNGQHTLPPEEHLSNRELEVFTMIGNGLSTAKIAKTLNLSRKTIDTHKDHIKKKLGVGDSVGLIQRATAWCMSESVI